MQTSALPKLALYKYDSCPYCQKVLQAISALNLRDQVELRDTRQDPAHRQALVTLTGSTQVPCLVIDGKPMLESSDIVDWLYAQFGKGEKPPRRGWF